MPAIRATSRRRRSRLVGNTDITLFNNTTNAPPATQDNTPVAERADYYDAGFTQQLTDREFKLGDRFLSTSCRRT